MPWQFSALTTRGGHLVGPGASAPIAATHTAWCEASDALTAHTAVDLTGVAGVQMCLIQREGQRPAASGGPEGLVELGLADADTTQDVKVDTFADQGTAVGEHLQPSLSGPGKHAAMITA